jgi:integrase/recombinase XerD
MLARQAKVLSAGQVKAVLSYLQTIRHPLRNRLIFLLSIKAGLRAKEIAELTWGMVTDAESVVANEIRLENSASKGKSGGIIALNSDLKDVLVEWRNQCTNVTRDTRVIQTSRSKATCSQVIVNLFGQWYLALGFDGCSSHSGRRTFITNAARKISLVGGSIRDVQALARHASLAMTQRYVEMDSEAQRKVVEMI